MLKFFSPQPLRSFKYSRTLFLVIKKSMTTTSGQDPRAKEFDPFHYLAFLPGAHDDINLLKQTFYTKLVERGLTYMYDKGFDVDPDSPILKTVEEQFEFRDDGKKTKNPKKVLVVGAGMAGLAAARELKRSGHKVSTVAQLGRFEFIRIFQLGFYVGVNQDFAVRILV